jgi:hypothetical protein
MMWTVDGVEQVDGKDYEMGVEERGRWKWKMNRGDEKEKERERRGNWCAFEGHHAKKRACVAKLTW